MEPKFLKVVADEVRGRLSREDYVLISRDGTKGAGQSSYYSFEVISAGRCQEIGMALSHMTKYHICADAVVASLRLSSTRQVFITVSAYEALKPTFDAPAVSFSEVIRLGHGIEEVFALEF